uniref:Uncharacterized protein n=1 Tax=Palpitomonas bilix TaxID=652834 RepID=A0A7S3LVS0_9EUKA|mmetsp:Transcript_50130/g.129022  ORF Transcript_50130/g.129022 Transcript_50130/m.129022 type:complete len:469 (+) Transcript_50130:921-2327(+)
MTAYGEQDLDVHQMLSKKLFRREIGHRREGLTSMLLCCVHVLDIAESVGFGYEGELRRTLAVNGTSASLENVFVTCSSQFAELVGERKSQSRLFYETKLKPLLIFIETVSSRSSRAANLYGAVSRYMNWLSDRLMLLHKASLQPLTSEVLDDFFGRVLRICTFLASHSIEYQRASHAAGRMPWRQSVVRSALSCVNAMKERLTVSFSKALEALSNMNEVKRGSFTIGKSRAEEVVILSQFLALFSARGKKIPTPAPSKPPSYQTNSVHDAPLSEWHMFIVDFIHVAGSALAPTSKSRSTDTETMADNTRNCGDDRWLRSCLLNFLLIEQEACMHQGHFEPCFGPLFAESGRWKGKACIMDLINIIEWSIENHSERIDIFTAACLLYSKHVSYYRAFFVGHEEGTAVLQQMHHQFAGVEKKLKDSESNGQADRLAPCRDMLSSTWPSDDGQAMADANVSMFPPSPFRQM